MKKTLQMAPKKLGKSPQISGDSGKSMECSSDSGDLVGADVSTPLSLEHSLQCALVSSRVGSGCFDTKLGCKFGFRIQLQYNMGTLKWHPG